MLVTGDREAAEAESRSALGGELPLDRGQLGRLVMGDGAAQQVADAELQRGDDGRACQPDCQRLAVVGVPPAAQHPDRVHRGDPERGRQLGADHHVARLGRPRLG